MMLGFIFALLSREASIILPLLLLSYHWSFKKRFLPREIFPVLGLSALYILWRFFANKHLFIHWVSHLSLMQRIAQGFASLIEYMRLLLVPFPLHMEYGTRAFPYWHPKVLFGAIFLCVGLWYVFKKKRDGLLCFCILWFFASLLPVSNLIPLGTYMAEHWLYLPSIGFFILSARTLSMLFGRVAIGLVCLALSVSMILTIRQNKTWMKRIHLYEHTLKYAPESLAALNNLGLEYSAASRYDEAITLFNKALAIDHRYADTYNNLGKVYFAKGDIDQAIGYYKKALEIDPLLAQGYNNIGIAYSHKKEYDEALKYLTQAITRNPNFVLGYFNLAATFADLNRFEEASQLYQRTIQLDPDFTYAYSNLGFLYAQLGVPAKAVPLYKKALALNPRLAQVYNNLGAAYLALNRVDKAKEAFRKTIETDPQYAAAYNNLAVIYFYAKDLSLAKEYCDKALLLGYPVNPEFLKSLKNSREN
jgi:tetratricopeptide (TPR) repeat protein